MSKQLKKKNNDFDAIIRDKMGDLRADYQPGSWDLLHQKLNRVQTKTQTAPHTERQLDEIFQSKLNKIQPAYRSDHWQQLAARLSLQQDRIHAILRSKASELIVALLLVWMVSQWTPYTTTPIYTAPAEPIYADKSNSSEQQRLEPSSKQEKELPANMLKQQRQKASSSKALMLATTRAKSRRIVSINEKSALATGVLSNARQRHGALAALPLLPERTPDNIQSERPPISIKEAIYKPLPINAFDFKPAEALAALNMVSLGALDYGELQLLGLNEIKPLEKRKTLRVGMMGAPDYNRIITPPQKVSDAGNTEIGIDRYALGYSGGITIGFDAYRWEIETGLMYAAQRYTPLQVLFVEGSVKTGFYAEKLKHFELNTIYIPLHLRYNFLVKDKWRIYGIGGGAWHLTMQANYYVDFQPNARLMAAPVSPESPYSPPSGIDNQNLVKGWLEGGSLQENSYFTVTGGLGVERYMTARWSIFGQPTYQHSLFHPNEGVGPFKDRINTFSILTGVKIRL